MRMEAAVPSGSPRREAGSKREVAKQPHRRQDRRTGARVGRGQAGSRWGGQAEFI